MGTLYSDLLFISNIVITLGWSI